MGVAVDVRDRKVDAAAAAAAEVHDADVQRLVILLAGFEHLPQGVFQDVQARLAAFGGLHAARGVENEEHVGRDAAGFLAEKDLDIFGLGREAGGAEAQQGGQGEMAMVFSFHLGSPGKATVVGIGFAH